MGLTVIMDFHQIEGVVFDDIAALNKDILAKTDFVHLYRDAIEHPDHNTPFDANTFEVLKQHGPNSIKIAEVCDGYFEGYSNYTYTYSYDVKGLAHVIAQHMTAGKLVLHLDIEGNPDEWFVVTPGNVATPTIKF